MPTTYIIRLVSVHTVYITFLDMDITNLKIYGKWENRTHYNFFLAVSTCVGAKVIKMLNTKNFFQCFYFLLFIYYLRITFDTLEIIFRHLQLPYKDDVTPSPPPKARSVDTGSQVDGYHGDGVNTMMRVLRPSNYTHTEVTW